MGSIEAARNAGATHANASVAARIMGTAANTRDGAGMLLPSVKQPWTDNIVGVLVMWAVRLTTEGRL